MKLNFDTTKYREQSTMSEKLTANIFEASIDIKLKAKVAFIYTPVN